MATLSKEELLAEAEELLDEEKYEDALPKLLEAIKQGAATADSYYVLGRTYTGLKKHDEAIVAYKKAIDIDPNDAYSFNGLGIIFLNLKRYDEALELFEKAKDKYPRKAVIYYHIGLVYNKTKKYGDAIKALKEAIRLEPKWEIPYNDLGISYRNIGKYKEAIASYNKSITRSKVYSNPYFNRATAYFLLTEYKKAMRDYEKKIELTKNNPDIFTQWAIEKVAEIKRLLDDKQYKSIIELVNKIKSLLRHKDGNVTHYTAFGTAQLLVLGRSPFRLSEGAFLNDTSEGKELFNYLGLNRTGAKELKDTEAKPFAQRPFIGSFVTEAKHDDLVLWRMYGKDNNVEAKGCAITMDAQALIDSINNKLNEGNKEAETSSEDDLTFYKVAYKNDKGRFMIPEATVDEVDLNKCMADLKTAVDEFNKSVAEKGETYSDERIKDVIELLNDIAYLFKSDEYQYEKELRLVVKKGIGFDKKIEHPTPDALKVYIETVDIVPLIRKITFGPKVERREEWASIFYYTVEKSGIQPPSIYISHLPFK